MWISLAIGLATFALSLAVRGHGNYSDTRMVSDFDQTVVAARLLIHHRDPYQLIGPGLAYSWGWKYYYPLTAAVLAIPFAALTLPIASALFAGISGGLLAFGVTRENYHRLPLFLSPAYYHATWLAQWSPLLTAAMLIPALGFAFPCKPTIGAALILSRPTWAAYFGGLAIVVASLAVNPTWPVEWYGIVSHGLHHRAPIMFTGGMVVLLALLRWRRADARLLLLLACVPQTADIFETLPLFLIPQTFRESVILATTATVAYAIYLAGPALPSLEAQASQTGWLLIAGCYVPALVMVLRRRNEPR